MAQITGGLVSIEDGKKAAEEYAPARKVRVDLSFSVAEGESYEAVFNMAADAANNRVAMLLGASPVALATSNGSPAPAAPTRTRRTKAEMEAAKAAAGNADPAAVDVDPTAGQEPVIHLPDASTVEDPASIGGSDGGVQTSADPAAIDGAEMVDEWDVQPEQPAEAAKEITDADLNSAVQKRNGELQAPQLIRDLIGSYNPDKSKPFQLRQIPQDERAGFIAKLAALTKAA